jgi:hypothetical protein
VSIGAGTALAPTFRHDRTSWFNLRAIPDYSPTALLADSPGTRAGLMEFLRGYGVEPALDPLADPLVKSQAYLARPDCAVPSRFSDGSYPVVYLADTEQTNLAEVGHHLARRLADTDAESTRTHYFLLAKFRLSGATLDVRKGFPRLHRRDDWAPAQAFGARAWSQGASGITYRSVRRAGAMNTAVFRAGLVKAGIRVGIIGLRWDGQGLARI